MDTSDQIALAALIVSALLSDAAIGVSVMSYRGSRREASRAAYAAERSAEAAEAAVALQREAAEKYDPDWGITHSHGDTFTITNECGERCEQVAVSGEAIAEPEIPEVLEPGEGGTFMVYPVFGIERKVTVTWRRPGSDDVWSRTYPLPGPPKIRFAGQVQ